MSTLAFRRDAGFSDRIAGLMDRVDYRLAERDEDLDEIFRLRYEAYMREGSIEPNALRQFCDAYDDSENASVFGAYIDGELVSSVRLHVATRDLPDCPSLEPFADILGPELAAGKVVVDSTRFVTDKSAARRFAGLHFVTLRLCWLAVEHVRADHFLAAVRKEHQAFYRRTFKHREICPPRPYAMLKAPISLMTVRYEEAADYVHGRYPFFRSNAFERRMLFERGFAGVPFADQREAA
jgi:N-acyl-L-homoserine lactone synthetase